MKTRTTSHRSPSAALPSNRRRWATVGVLAASAALAGRVSAASVQLPPEFRARNVEPLPAAWLRDERHAAPDVTIAPAVVRTDEQLPAVTRFDIPPGPLSSVIKAFEAVTGYTVTLAEPALGDIPSPGVSGVTTTDKAIAAILSGTGIIARETGLRQLTLAVGGVSESLDVTGTTRVASPRYVRPVSETPQSIQVIPRQVMEAQGVTTLSEALRNVPGISLQAGEGGGASNTSGDMFNLRGFSANNSLFVDGVRDDGLVSRDVYNLEQVEVFLGPAGTDVGRGTAAGYVNMTTKTPAVQTRYSGAATFGTADQRRVSVDVNQATPFGEAGSWWRGTAVRLNGLVQDSGVPGRDEVRLRSQAIAPSLAFGLGTHVRVAGGGQFLHQDNLPDYGIPGAAWPDGPLVPGAAVAPNPVDQSNYYGTPANDSDEVSQDSGFAKVEYDVRPTVQLRSQLRYNQAHRTAVISTIQNPAAYNPATELVTIARQGNERENEITSSQTSVSTVARAGRTSHALIGTVEFTSESQFAPTLGGLGTRPPANIYAPDVNVPVTGMDVARTGAFSDGTASTAAVSVFDTVDVGSRLQLTGGMRVERYGATFLARDAAGVATTDVDTDDTLFSGKVGRALQAHRPGQRLLRVGEHQDAARHRELHVERAAQQPEQPQRRPADLDQRRGRQQVGVLRQPALADRRGVPHEERERHLHGGRDRRAAGLQPGRRTARHGREPRRLGADHSRARRHRELRVSRLREPVPEPGQRRQAPHAHARLLGQRLGDLHDADSPLGRRRRALHRRGLRQRREHDQVARLPDRGRDGDLRPDQPGVAAPQRLQRDERDLHPQHQQQRRPLQPGAPAHGHADGQLRILRC